MNLSGRTFRVVVNSENGSLNTETEIRFTSDDGIVVGNYSGGTIVAGHVLGKHLGESEGNGSLGIGPKDDLNGS